MATSNSRQPFSAHIEELRYRLTWIVVALVLGSTLGYFLRDLLLQLLSAPLGLPLYYTSPGGGFSLIVQLCLGFGLAITVPVIVFHLLRFVAPILPNYSTKLLISILSASTVLVIAGVLFAYYVSLPAALYFLGEFSNNQVQALITTDTYISFVSIYLVGFAVLFQLPLFLLLINRITPMQPKTLAKQVRWVILGAVVVAAILTPTPDPFNQLIMAGPVVGLYGLSIGMVGMVNYRRKPNYELKTVEDLLLDLSNKQITSKLAAAHQGRSGHICLWEEKGWQQSKSQTVTFLYKGKHELIVDQEQGKEEIGVPALF